jgi:hypothetical protein
MLDARTLGTVRFALVLVALLVLLTPAAARADGDPASDVLYLQDVYLPYQHPSSETAADLSAAVATANAAGYRMKVAVIAAQEDLGLVGSLFGQPQTYARFLGAEIQSFFSGHLLVVMPQGYGIWFNRLDVSAQQALLAGAKIEAGDPEGLTKAAAAAVRLLVARDHSKPRATDTTPPRVHALAASFKRGAVAHLRYTVSDNSGRSREEIRIYGDKLALLALLRDPAERADGRRDEVLWPTLHYVKPQHFHFCVVAVDPSGNQSKASCAALALF